MSGLKKFEMYSKEKLFNLFNRNFCYYCEDPVKYNEHWGCDTCYCCLCDTCFKELKEPFPKEGYFCVECRDENYGKSDDEEEEDKEKNEEDSDEEKED